MRRTSRRPKRRSKRNPAAAAETVLKRVKPAHLADFLALAERMRTGKFGFDPEPGYFARHGGKVENIAAASPLSERRVAFLLRSYAQEYAELFGHETGVYMKAEYQPSGSGTFGRYSNKRARYDAPRVMFYTKSRS